MFTERKQRLQGFTLLEVVFGMAVLAVALLAFYLTMSRSLLLSETNKQVKIALFDAQTIVEELMGVPFDEIMDPDYPTPDMPKPRYRHRQEVAHERLFGTDPATGDPNPPRLEDQIVRVWYGSRLDLNDVNGNGDTTDAEPLVIVPGSDSPSYPLKPSPSNPTERFRPANNSPLADQFVTPEPLYVTVEVSWVSRSAVLDANGDPVRTVQRLTFVRSR